MSYKILNFDQLNSSEWDGLLTNLRGNTFLNCADMIKYKTNLSNTKNISFAIFEFGSKSKFGPPSAFNAIDKTLAVVVSPTPLGPLKIYP